MSHNHEFYIDGAWCAPAQTRLLDVIDPATEKTCATIALGDTTDVDRAVAAARRAFPSWSSTTKEERLAVMRRLLALYDSRAEDMAQAITLEMGAPIAFSRSSQAYVGSAHLAETIRALEAFPLNTPEGDVLLTYEAVGVAGLITPWNWPMNQVMCKVAPALAAGCTIILKPSEIAPLSSILFTELMHEAGVPPGVFNMIHGTGPEVGAALASHPGIDMISVTGSTRAGAAVAHAAADSIKRVHQELGGKSPNIILPSADFEEAVRRGVRKCFSNTGQSCDAPTRMLVPGEKMEDAIAIARSEAETIRTGNPQDETTKLGPLVSDLQYSRVQALIEKGISEGATLAAGGLGRPDDLPVGYYVRPTVFGHVTPDMTIFKEEIFGPVLAITGYDTIDHAIELGNDTPYGLGAYIQGDLAEARQIARKIRAGNVTINDAAWSVSAPFGGFGQSGNGREYGVHGLRDFLEIKAIIGFGRA